MTFKAIRNKGLNPQLVSKTYGMGHEDYDGVNNK